MSSQSNDRLTRKEMLALRGLRLPTDTLLSLRKSGIYCVPAVSIEHQRSAKRFVIHAQESGGAVADIGAYCGFVSVAGEGLPWLQRVDSFAVNGIHARVVTTELVRIQVIRVLRTYNLLITKHALLAGEAHKRPRLANSILFYGHQGSLELELWGKDKDISGSILPQFFDRAGEHITVPAAFQTTAKQVIAGATCSGCRHVHVCVPPSADGTTEGELVA